MNDLENFYAEVARVAHDLYEKRGKVHGHDMEDWLKAEMIVKTRYNKETNPEGKPIPSRNSLKTREKTRSKKIQ